MRNILFSLLLVAGVNASAASDTATDAAFAALFSMPGAKPAMGSWTFPPAAGFKPGPEPTLIAFLARQKKAGADFNAYRHQGTLLHHAIRAKLPATAAWLLANGADPRRNVREPVSDTLSLSLSYELPTITRLLTKKYRMVLPPAGPPVANQAPVDEKANIAATIAALATDPALLAEMLATTPQAALDQHAEAIMAQMVRDAEAGGEDATGAAKYVFPAESWRLLWRRLRKPVPFSERPGLGSRMDAVLWPELVAAGHSPRAEDALACMLSTVPAKRLAALWPQMLDAFPDLKQVAPRMVLGPYRLGERLGCTRPDEDDTIAKLAFLSARGLRMPVAGLYEQSFAGTSPTLLAAARSFIPQASQVAPRLTSVQPACQFTMTDLWYNALMNKEGWKVDTVQLLEVPGEAQCAVLVGGDDRSYFPRSALVDAFTGPEQDPVPSCPDPSDAYEVWRQVGGKIVKTDTSLGHDFTYGAIMPVRDKVTGRRYYLNYGTFAGRCHGADRMPFGFEWRDGRLVESYPGELQNILYEQCKTDEAPFSCPGLVGMSPGDSEVSRPESLFEGVSMESLLREQDKPKPAPVDSEALQAKYIAAAMAPDRALLKQLQAQGVAATTIARAIKAVSNADLPIEEKRKRLAPLFFDHARLAQAFDDEWPQLLVDWLPYQDWRPVVKAIALFGPDGFQRADELRRVAGEQNMSKLACDIDRARGWICGETISRDD